MGGRVDFEGSGGGREPSDSAFTFASVEARLVEAVRCWWRMPGGGRWPFASDGPWHLIRPQEGDYDVGYDKDGKPVKLSDREGAPPPRPLPLTRAEVAEMEAATEWLTKLSEEERRVVVLAIGALARGEARVPWSRIRERFDLAQRPSALARRYERALAVLSLRLSGLSEERARRMVRANGVRRAPAPGPKPVDPNLYAGPRGGRTVVRVLRAKRK